VTSLQTGGHLLQNILNNLLQTAGTNASPNDKAIVDIVLKSAGGTIINVVRELHESLGISLIEAKKLVDNAPTTIMTGAAKDAAEALKAALVALGAEVELR
jgi:large subunit ribosomal protein L7/L12